MDNDYRSANNTNTDKNTLKTLSQHRNEVVRAAVAYNSNSDTETLLSLVGDKSKCVRDNLHNNRSTFDGSHYVVKFTKNIKFRLICEDDADFILSLRLNEKLNKNLSKVENNLKKQIHWIKEYKKKEEKRLEFYFIIESLDDEKLGAVRLYDFIEDSFCWGSWLLKIDSPNYASIESALSVYEFGFERLGFQHSHFDVRKGNEKVIKFHKRFGANIVDEDELNFYFKFDKETYYSSKVKYTKFFTPNN